MQIKTNKKTQAGLYDFAHSAGVVGVQNLGVHLPLLQLAPTVIIPGGGVWITGFWVTAYTLLTSAGAATVSFGTITTDIAIPVAVVNNLMVANVFGAFTAQPLQGVDLDATPLRLNNSVDIIMAIAGANLTGGKLAFIIEYSEILPAV